MERGAAAAFAEGVVGETSPLQNYAIALIFMSLTMVHAHPPIRRQLGCRIGSARDLCLR